MPLEYCNIETGPHDHTLDRGYEVLGHKVRHHVRLNTYDFQSHAKAEVWSTATMSWNEVATVPYQQWWEEYYGKTWRDGLLAADAELEARVRATIT